MTVRDIERAIEDLPKNELAELSAWFEKYEAEMWDEQIGNDLATGRFEALRAEAMADFDTGRTRPL
jgi:hypothetical protein